MPWIARAVKRVEKRVAHRHGALRLRAVVGFGVGRPSLQRHDVFVRQLEVYRERRDDLLLLLNGSDRGIQLRGLAQQRARALARAIQRAADAVAAAQQPLELPIHSAQRLLRLVGRDEVLAVDLQAVPLHGPAQTAPRRGGVLGVEIGEAPQAREDLGRVHGGLEHLFDLARDAGRESHREKAGRATRATPRARALAVAKRER